MSKGEVMVEGLPSYSFAKLEDGRVGWAMAGWGLGGTNTTREWHYNRVINRLLQLHTSTCKRKPAKWGLSLCMWV